MTWMHQSFSNIEVVTSFLGLSIFIHQTRLEGLAEELKKLRAKTTNGFLRKLKGGTQLPTHSWASKGTHEHAPTQILYTHAQSDTRPTCIDTHWGPQYVGHCAEGIFRATAVSFSVDPLDNTRKDVPANTSAFSHTESKPQMCRPCACRHQKKRWEETALFFSSAVVTP